VVSIDVVTSNLCFAVEYPLRIQREFRGVSHAKEEGVLTSQISLLYPVYPCFVILTFLVIVVSAAK
jgi:hypothetical protein